MPRVVDHDLRRREVVEALLMIAARDGLHAATSRAIAAELGVATGALWHYFSNFDQVLSQAFSAVFERTNERIEAATCGRSGLHALRAMMHEVLPTTLLTQDEARLVVDFWGRVALDNSLAVHQLEFESIWRDGLLRYLEQGIHLGELNTGSRIDDIADQLLVLATGQQVAFVLGSALGAPERQAPLVEAILAPWLGRVSATDLPPSRLVPPTGS